MARIGNTIITPGAEGRQVTGEDYGNIVAHPYTIEQDGWITDIRVQAGGEGGTVDAKLAVWDADTGDVIYASTEQTWSNSISLRVATPESPIPVSAGTNIRIGFWRDRRQKSKFALYTKGDPSHIGTYTARREVPSFPTYDLANGQLAGDIQFVANAAPDTPEYIDPTPEDEAEITTTKPAVALALPHSADGLYDYTDAVHVRITRDNGNVEYNAEMECTPQERITGIFQRENFVVLIHDRHYYVQVRQRDKWGKWSLWTKRRRFKVKAGPKKPLLLTPTPPAQRITAAKPANFTGTYTSDQGKAFSAVQIEIWNEQGTRRLQQSGDRGSSPAVSGTFEAVWTVSDLSWMTDLKFGTKYRWRARVKDVSGDYSEWSARFPFYTNAAPNVPNKLKPADGKITNDPILTMSLSDPDNDPITKVDVRVFDVTNNVPIYVAPQWATSTVYTVGTRLIPRTANINGNVYEVTVAGGGHSGTVEPVWPTTLNATVTVNGYTYKNVGSDQDHSATISTDGKTAQFNIIGFAVLGRSYKWQARAYDNGLPSPSPFSAWQDFLFNTSPTLSVLAPLSALEKNLIAQPSAEYDPAVVGSWWALSGTAGGNTINRISDGDVAYGNFCFQGNVTDITNVLKYESPMIAINPGKPLLLYGWFKREQLANAATTTFRLDCYNSSGTLTGSLFPTTFGVLNNSDPTLSWSKYGGFINAVGGGGIALPSNTIQVKVVIIPSATTASRVRFDGFRLMQVEVTTEIHWYGYFDGDYIGFGAADSYTWDSVAGNSSTTGVSILENPGANIVYSYASAGSLNKLSDKITVQRWTGKEWKTVYTDTGFITGRGGLTPGSTTLFSIPPNTVRNNGRYRVKVEAKDTTGLTGSTDFVEFDVMYQGPPELVILQADGSPDLGTINLSWRNSTLPAIEFAGIEIAKEPGGGGPKTIVDVINDVNVTSYTYHFPISGEPYTFRIRQAQNIGGDVVHSRWYSANVMVDYHPNWFFKDAEDPTTHNVGFVVQAEDTPNFKYVGDVEKFRPWGRKVPVHLVGEQDSTEGSIKIRLRENDVVPGSTLDKLIQLIRLRRTTCYMSHQPPRKTFVEIMDVTETAPDLPWHTELDIAWEQTAYEEDFYVREALEE